MQLEPDQVLNLPRTHEGQWLECAIATRTGIIIANTGTPAMPTSDAVGAYLHRFLSDPRICPMNPHLWHFILDRFIIPRRAPVSARKYASIWMPQGSPLDVHMNSLACKLDKTFAEEDQGDIVTVTYAMSYSSPTFDDALEVCRQARCERLVVVPLYPQSAFSTTQAAQDAFIRALEQTDWSPELHFIEAYGDNAFYIDAIADSARAKGFDARQGDKLLLAFHSIPMADIRNCDTYDVQTQRTAHEVARVLSLEEGNWGIGYQCRFDKSRAWLGPSTTTALDVLGDARRLFVVAPNFSVDCLETLYDIQVELRDLWLAKGTRRDYASFCYVPCLNDSDAHVRLLRHLILEA